VTITALGIAVWSHFLLQPQIMAIGRILDFPSPSAEAQYQSQFAAVHRMYGIAGLLRAGACLGLMYQLLRRGFEVPLRRRKTDKVDVINKTDYSHINR
jgi:hypothetical protein